ncbi:Sorting nexin-2 [Taenia solium]|eukprot:TsM_000580100 transcript=TsM_000580100 gene=TsM_000580100
MSGAEVDRGKCQGRRFEGKTVYLGVGAFENNDGTGRGAGGHSQATATVPGVVPLSESQPFASEANMISVKVLNPEKVGEGMSSYVVYTVKTTTNMPCFKNSSMCVHRRFSDFLGLHEKLKAKYIPQGIIIPCPPEKNVLGTTKMRLSKSSSADSDFIEKRRVSLEWIVNHPILRVDHSVHEFLELQSELPRYNSAQSLSGVAAMKLLKNVGEVVGKLTFRMDEFDEYFDLKDDELENWDIQGSRLYAALSNLVLDQNDLVASTLASSKALSVLANVEEHTGLARALGQLADTEEQISHFLSVEAEAQSTFLAEYAKGVLSSVQACRDTLAERIRVFKMHRDCESALRGKREQKVRIEMSPKADRAKIPTLEREIGELAQRAEESEEEFEKISSTIKKEFEHVDEARFKEFREAVLSYLTMLLQMQEKTLKAWESFIGHAKAIE